VYFRFCERRYRRKTEHSGAITISCEPSGGGGGVGME